MTFAFLFESGKTYFRVSFFFASPETFGGRARRHHRRGTTINHASSAAAPLSIDCLISIRNPLFRESGYWDPFVTHYGSYFFFFFFLLLFLYPTWKGVRDGCDGSGDVLYYPTYLAVPYSAVGYYLCAWMRCGIAEHIGFCRVVRLIENRRERLLTFRYSNGF